MCSEEDFVPVETFAVFSIFDLGILLTRIEKTSASVDVVELGDFMLKIEDITEFYRYGFMCKISQLLTN